MMTTGIHRAERAPQVVYDIVKDMEVDGTEPARRAYQNAGDPVTIGFGHTGKIYRDGELRELRLGDEITNEEAHELFNNMDAPEAERRIEFFFPELSLTPLQRGALWSLAFNIRWESLQNSTLRKMIRGGENNKDGWTRETLIEWWVKYRNPNTIYEEGLYRRRIWELCMWFGADPMISFSIAWTAQLRRASDGSISFQTNPELLIMKAENATRSKRLEQEAKAKPAASESDAAAETSSPAPVAPEAPVSPVEGNDMAPAAETRPKPIETQAPAVVIEPLPEIEEAPKPAPSTQPPTPPKHKAQPYKDFDPAREPKSIALSKRVHGFYLLLIGWLSMIGEALAELPFTHQIANMSPFKVGDWKFAMLIIMAGFLLYWYGQVKAKGPLK